MSMHDSDGIDEALQGVTQIALTTAGRMGEQMARLRERQAREAQARSEQAARENAERMRAEREAARAALAPVHRDQWWDTATAEDVTRAYQTATAWRDVDPQAARAEARIVEQARARHGIDLREQPTMRPEPQVRPDWLERHEASRSRAAEYLTKPLPAPSEEVRQEMVAMLQGARREDVLELGRTAVGPEWDNIVRERPEAILLATRAAAEVRVDPRSESADAATEVLHAIYRKGAQGSVPEQMAQHLRAELSSISDPSQISAALDRVEQAATEAREQRTKAGSERAEAAGLLAGADALDAHAELEHEREHQAQEVEGDGPGLHAHHEGGAALTADERRDQAGHAYDSAERREAMAKGLDHVENRGAVNARVRSDVAQGRPATDAVSSAPGRAPKARKAKSSAQTARTAQRTGQSR